MHRAAALTLATALLLQRPAALRDAELLAKAVLKAAAGEGFAEPDPELPRIESRAIAGLLALWSALEANTLQVLGLDAADSGKAMKAEPLAFAFDPVGSLSELLRLQQVFINAAGADDGPLVQQAFAAWLRGIANARAEVEGGAVVAEAQREYRALIQQRGLELVRNATIRSFRNDIVQRLIAGDLDGLNPREVARTLRQRFGAHDYDWERLARSEIAQAQVDGKDAQYEAAGIEEVNYTTANDEDVSTLCRTLAAGNPYPRATAPKPVRNSHPGCRCTWKPAVD
jgi:SPP1 gp7 family putative phage head morphogenesis protein